MASAQAKALIQLLTAMLANSHRFVRAVMAVELVTAESVPVRPEFRRFAEDVEITVRRLAEDLRLEIGLESGAEVGAGSRVEKKGDMRLPDPA